MIQGKPLDFLASFGFVYIEKKIGGCIEVVEA